MLIIGSMIQKVSFRRWPMWAIVCALLLTQPAAWAQPGRDEWYGEDLLQENTLWDRKPAEGWVVWASNRLDGLHEIYLMSATGRDDVDVTRLTFGGGKMPIWSPDGRWIAYHHTSDNTSHVTRWDKSEDKEIFRGPPLFWMFDNSGVVCRDGDDFFLVEPDFMETTMLFSKGDFPQLASSTMDPGGITADGRWLLAHTRLFRDGFTADNGSYKWGDSAVILDLTDPDRLYFFGPGCEPTAAPTGDQIYHVCGDFSICPTGPDLYQMNVNDFFSRTSYAPVVALPRSLFGHEYFPRVSTDNRWLVYGATDGCHDHENCNYEIFIHPLDGGISERVRITFNSRNDQWPHLFVGPLLNPESLSQLQLSQERIFFSANVEHDPEEQLIIAKNIGGGSLGQLKTNIQYGTVAGWLSVSNGEEGGAQVLVNGVRVEGLEPGTYTATVAVMEAVSLNRPRHYQVELLLSRREPVEPVEPVLSEGTQGCQLTGYPSLSGGVWLLLALLPRRRRIRSREVHR